MKVDNLREVNRLIKNMEELKKQHDSLKSLLGVNKFGLPQKVRLEIGGDEYGNGKHQTVVADIQDVEYVVKLIGKQISDKWGRIVGIRMKLRDLGVEL